MGVVVDTELVERVVALSGERTKKAAVEKALHEFIGRRQTAKQRELLNNSRLTGNASGKKTRRRR